MLEIQLGKPGDRRKTALYGIYSGNPKENCEQIDVEESSCSGTSQKALQGRRSRPERAYKITAKNHNERHDVVREC